MVVEVTGENGITRRERRAKRREQPRPYVSSVDFTEARGRKYEYYGADDNNGDPYKVRSPPTLWRMSRIILTICCYWKDMIAQYERSPNFLTHAQLSSRMCKPICYGLDGLRREVHGPREEDRPLGTLRIGRQGSYPSLYCLRRKRLCK